MNETLETKKENTIVCVGDLPVAFDLLKNNNVQFAVYWKHTFSLRSVCSLRMFVVTSYR